jgi:hypothetical protein
MPEFHFFEWLKIEDFDAFVALAYKIHQSMNDTSWISSMGAWFNQSSIVRYPRKYKAGLCTHFLLAWETPSSQTPRMVTIFAFATQCADIAHQRASLARAILNI